MTEKKDQINIDYLPEEEESAEKKDSGNKAPKRSKSTEAKDVAALKEKLEKQHRIFEKVVKERDEFKDKYLRNLAEVDNFRKRLKKEKEDFQKFVLGEFFLELLPIIDNLERALKVEKKEKSSSSILSGVEMIHKQMMDLLKKFDVVEIDAQNKPFDPNYHQALSKEEREGIDDAVIIEVYQKGFLYNDKLLRPTLAKVAVPATAASSDQETPEAE